MAENDTNNSFLETAWDNFDSNEGWIVQGLDMEGKRISYEGMGRNQELMLILNFSDDEDHFSELVTKYLAANGGKKENIVIEYFPPEFLEELKSNSTGPLPIDELNEMI